MKLSSRLGYLSGSPLCQNWHAVAGKPYRSRVSFLYWQCWPARWLWFV